MQFIAWLKEVGEVLALCAGGMLFVGALAMLAIWHTDGREAAEKAAGGYYITVIEWSAKLILYLACCGVFVGILWCVSWLIRHL